ncbi:MAG: AzlD domain-containing protein [Syntrophomonadaceae bacterium]|nr:AzlD domain-containing protein [Syntrophomonadaceae bacterium]
MKTDLFWLIIGMSLATAIPRVLPVIIFSRFEFPEKLKEWLSYIAPAVLGALLAVSILAPHGTLDISVSNRYIWVFIPTMLVAIYTRSLFYTLVVGIGIMALSNWIVQII